MLVENLYPVGNRLAIADRKLSDMVDDVEKVGNSTEDTAPVDIHYEPINETGRNGV